MQNKSPISRLVVWILGLLMFSSHLLALASTPSAISAFPEHDTMGAILVVEKCSSCHGAPRPNIHTANTWPGVVYRMQMHMTTKGENPLTKDEIKLIVEYLQRYAATEN